MAKVKPAPPPMQLHLTAAGTEVTVSALPIQIIAPPGGTIYDWEWPEVCKATRKIASTLIITDAPDGTHTVSVKVFTQANKPGIKPRLEEGRITFIVKLAP